MRITDFLAELDGVEFFGQATHRGSSEGFGVSQIEGLLDGVDRSIDSVKRPQSAGDFPAQDFEESRVITISGTCDADSPVKLMHFRDRLMGILSGGRTGTLVFQYLGEARAMQVQRYRKPKFTPFHAWNGVDAEYSIQLYAADPFMYGETRTFTETVDGFLPVEQWGNTTAFGSMTALATSTMTGYQLKLFTLDGFQLGNLRMNGLTAGQTHTVNMLTGTVTRGGVVLEDAVYSGQPWGIPQGQFKAQLETVSGAGRISALSVRDTWE